MSQKASSIPPVSATPATLASTDLLPKKATRAIKHKIRKAKKDLGYERDEARPFFLGLLEMVERGDLSGVRTWLVDRIALATKRTEDFEQFVATLEGVLKDNRERRARKEAGLE